jgi:squalene-associated FAD-dependent desaturase
MPATIHVVGAGVAGLAAAVRLCSGGAQVVLHEAAPQAGGRCRSYFDPQLNATIDNGNHLILSGNRATLAYAGMLGAAHLLSGPGRAEFAFVDLASEQRWRVHLSEGRLPLWIFDRRRRVPGTRARDYLALAPLLWAKAGQTMNNAMRCPPRLYERLIQPFFLAVLNTDPQEGSARLAAAVLRETLAAGGRACHPLIASSGLDAVFVAPALRYLEAHGARVRLQQRLRAISFEAHGAQASIGARAAALDFGTGPEPLGADDAVVLAVPPNVATALVPGLCAPTEFRSIVNAHFQVAAPPGCPPMLGVIHGLTEWIFAFEGRLSVTISGADRLLETPREELALRIWQEVARAVGLPPAPLPRWQIVREKRATFAATPAQNALRPPARTAWRNLALAGDWIDTGLPATLEGAIRAGNGAADLLRDSGFGRA